MNKKFRQENAFGYVPKKKPKLKFTECRVCKREVVIGSSHFKTHRLAWRNYTLMRTTPSNFDQHDAA